MVGLFDGLKDPAPGSDSREKALKYGVIVPIEDILAV